MKISGWVFPKINWLSIVLKQSVIFQSLLEQCFQQKNYGKFCNPFIALYPKNNTILLIHLKGVSRWCKATDNIIQRFNETVVFYVFIMHVVFWGFNSTNIEESPVGFWHSNRMITYSGLRDYRWMLSLSLYHGVILLPRKRKLNEFLLGIYLQNINENDFLVTCLL